MTDSQRMRKLVGMTNRKAPVSREQSTTIVDMRTGEVVEKVQEKTCFLDREPEYIKVYIDPALECFGTDLALAPYLLAFCRHMTYASSFRREYACTVRTDSLVRKDVANALHVSERAVYAAQRRLVECGLFLPVVVDGKKKRGLYFVNPWIVSKGEWRDIKALRSGFHYTTRYETSVVMDADGKPQILFSVSGDEEEEKGGTGG